MNKVDPFLLFMAVITTLILGLFVYSAKESIHCDNKGGFHTRYGCLRKECKIYD